MSDPKYKNVGDPLVRLAEECAEVIHIICKIQRFGIENYHPKDPNKTPNVYLLRGEISDLETVIDEVCDLYPWVQVSSAPFVPDPPEGGDG